MYLHFALTFLVKIVLFNNLVEGYTLENVEKLLSDKFDSSKYNKEIRGQTEFSSPMNVTIDLGLKSIIEINEIKESIEVLALIFVEWKDERLIWDSSDYNGTYEVFRPVDTVWHPEIFIERVTSRPAVFGNPERQLSKHDSNGMAIWSFVDFVTFSCAFDLTSFPWDVQTCDILFVVWGYQSWHVHVSSNLKQIILEYYTENSSWEITSSRVYDAETGPKSRVAYQIVLRRRPDFFLITMFLPTIFLSIMSLLVYAVPIESGERISFSLTTLLSIILFMTLLSSTIPQSAETIPAMCYFLLSELCKCLIVCICNIISLTLYHKDEKAGNPGTVWKKIVCICLRRKSACKKNKLDQNNTELIQINQDGDILKPSKESSEALNKTEQPDINWKDVSRVLDRVFFFGMTLISVFIYCMFISHM